MQPGCAWPLPRPACTGTSRRYWAPAQPRASLLALLADLFPPPQLSTCQLQWSVGWVPGGNEPCVRHMPGSRYHAADAAVYRCLRALHGRARHTGATWQPQGENPSPAVLQGHTAAQLKVGITHKLSASVRLIVAYLLWCLQVPGQLGTGVRVFLG